MTDKLDTPCGEAALRLADWARGRLRAHAGRIEDDPQTNSVFALAQEWFQALEAGKVSTAELTQGAGCLYGEALTARSLRLRARHEAFGEPDPWGEVRAALSRLAEQGFEAFAGAFTDGAGGVVFTAHPTFAMSAEERAALARAAADPAGPAAAELRALAGRARAAPPITLEAEHGEAQAAIARAQEAQREYLELLIDHTSAAFPGAWRRFDPDAPTIASWVGYDLDGRTDITWVQSFALRLRERAMQLGRWAERLAELESAHGARPALSEARGEVDAAWRAAEAEAAAFGEAQHDPEALPRAIALLCERKAERLTDLSPLIETLDRAFEREASDALARDWAVLRAQMRSLGLGTARIHLRLNAAQIRTVVRNELKLNTEDAALGRRAMRQLSELAVSCKPEPISFAALEAETSTARRQFMLCAMMLRYVDAQTPIRFLIAEAENPATVMGALYLARRYGVAGRLDISPLFETPEAMERGARFMARLLDEQTYLDYVRERGRLCVQFGFSDSGRFIGQAAAQMAIERLQNLIGRAMGERGVEAPLVTFNTHGESMGRGGYPGGLRERLDHLVTPWTRARFGVRGQRILNETSYQGGDGFVHFATPALARSTFAAHALHLLDRPGPGDEALADPFYAETEFVWDFYRALRRWQEDLCADPDYAVILNSFAASFLATAGSRQTRRPDASAGPRGLRAISNNALLQQLAAPINVACGFGSAASAESDRLVDLANASPRLRALMRLAFKARVLTSSPALRAYAEVYSPAFWVAISKQAEQDRTETYVTLARQFGDYAVYGGFQRISDRIALDLGQFDRVLEGVANAPSPAERHEGRLDLHILHAMRLALMMRSLALAARAPHFSGRHGVSFDELIDLAAHMRLTEAVALLRSIFPLSEENEARHQALLAAEGLAAGGAQPAHETYRAIHREITDELEAIAEAMGAISLAICQFYDAYG